MKAMVLAAGLGTRLRPYTDQFAKPALPFLNIPLLYYPVFLLQKAGVDTMVFNGHHHAGQIQSLIAKIPGFTGRTEFSLEAEKPLGSGGGVWQGGRFLKGSGAFFLANGDEVILPPTLESLKSLRNAHELRKAFATILVMKHPEVGTKFGGVWADSTGRVAGFGKTAPPSTQPLKAYHYIGIQILDDGIFTYLPDGESNILYDALKAAIDDGKLVYIHYEDCTWFETGNPADFINGVTSCLEKEVAGPHRLLFEAMFAQFWPRFSERRSIWQGADCRHLLGDAIAGKVLMGNGCRVGAQSKLNRVVLGNNVQIGMKCELENCMIMSDAEIRDGVSIRDRIVLPRDRQ